MGTGFRQAASRARAECLGACVGRASAFAGRDEGRAINKDQVAKGLWARPSEQRGLPWSLCVRRTRGSMCRGQDVGRPLRGLQQSPRQAVRRPDRADTGSSRRGDGVERYQGGDSGRMVGVHGVLA